MGEGESFKVIYEARRQARGDVKPPSAKGLRRKLALSGAGIAVACVAGFGTWFWHGLTHVRTVRASACAALVELAPEFDARVKIVSVKPGDHVAAGQTLLMFDDTESQANCAAARAKVSTLTARVESARKALELRRARLNEEIRRAEADMNAAKAASNLLQQGARKERVETARVRLDTARAQREFLAAELTETEKLVKAGYVSAHTLKEDQIRLFAQGNTVREAELELQQLMAGPSAEEIKMASETLAARQAALALARTGEKDAEALAAELVGRQAELDEAKAMADRADASLGKMKIISPAEGTVLRTFRQPGEMCLKGQTAVLLTDDLKGRWVEGYILEKDATRIHEGQAVRLEIVVGSHNYINGKIESVGLTTNSIGRSGISTSNSQNFTGPELVWVKFRPASASEQIMPGMSARAVIRVR